MLSLSIIHCVISIRKSTFIGLITFHSWDKSCNRFRLISSPTFITFYSLMKPYNTFPTTKTLEKIDKYSILMQQNLIRTIRLMLNRYVLWIICIILQYFYILDIFHCFASCIRNYVNIFHMHDINFIIRCILLRYLRWIRCLISCLGKAIICSSSRNALLVSIHLFQSPRQAAQACRDNEDHL